MELKMPTYDEIARRLDDSGGLYVTRMEELREAHEAGRLGVNVRYAISDRLRSRGIGHLPAELPSYQEDEVRLYRLGDPIGKVIDAVINPSEPGDQVLRQSVGSTATDILARVRELVCEG
jgi:hypothetical protein